MGTFFINRQRFPLAEFRVSERLLWNHTFDVQGPDSANLVPWQDAWVGQVGWAPSAKSIDFVLVRLPCQTYYIKWLRRANQMSMIGGWSSAHGQRYFLPIPSHSWVLFGFVTLSASSSSFRESWLQLQEARCETVSRPRLQRNDRFWRKSAEIFIGSGLLHWQPHSRQGVRRRPETNRVRGIFPSVWK